MKALENQDPNDEQQDSDDKKIKFATSLAPNRFTKIDIFRALDSFRRKFKCPGKNHGHRKSDNEQQHHKAHCPIRNLEERKNLTRDLHQQPRHHAISDRNFVNVASLQFSEEVLRVHRNFLINFESVGSRFVLCTSYGGMPIRRSRSAKRGSLRIVSHTGSSL
jgi:hypothetical protein